MNKHIFTAAFGVGALVVLWIATGFLGSQHLLALLMTLLIGAVYGYGALELRRFRQLSTALCVALSALPEHLTDLHAWLATVPASLQNPVRLRIEGERAGLPGPSLTPYLVGLLVMLGMLGTFLGMVITLNGAVFALEGTSDLAAIRSAFATPIKGLGLSFGTSVAGVATSAMLGLMSAVSRHERMLASHLLDTKIATTLRCFTHTYLRHETFSVLQLQSQALPAVVDQLQAMMARMEGMGQRLDDRLLSNQTAFHQSAHTVYSELAKSVDQSLRSSLHDSAQAASDSIRPVVEAALAGISHEARALHQRMVDTTQVQLDGLAQRLQDTAHAVTAHTQAAAQQSLHAIGQLIASSETLAHARMAAEADWDTLQRERTDQMAQALREELSALRAEETQRGVAAVARLGELQAAVTTHLSTLGTALEDPITRLIHTASQAPRAAAEVIGTLRQEISNSVARDNELLEERSRIMATLATLLDAINHASAEQRSVIDALVASSAHALGQVGQQFASSVAAESAKLGEIAATVTSSAVDVASLGDSLRFAVQCFQEANDKLVANLQRIEGAMDKSMARSDDQLAYYVAQAREVIDLSIGSQRDIVDQLHALADRQARLGEAVA